ncbi:MAG: response regulator [Nitrospirota bacterium]|nr:response regulator [Nitrospirota bacterium]
MSKAQQKNSILVVAKDPDLRMIVRLAMEEAGYEVHEAQAVQECCAAHEKFHPLMIVDLSKSQEGELDAMLTAKREHPEMKIIAIGGGSRPINRLFEDNPSGVARTFWKPFELGDLVRAVEKELRITARGLLNV